MANDVLPRAFGLLVLEVVDSNPNGDPDRESDPRTRDDDIGLITPVSFKRKVRDLVMDKEGPVWTTVSDRFTPSLDPERYQILEQPDRDREQINNEIAEGTFLGKYWDARLFGSTFLEGDEKGTIVTGAVQFGLGKSVAPVVIERHTMTNISPVEKGKSRGMAPLAFRIVRHGIYTMPFFVNPSLARKSGCTAQDVELLLHVIPHAYANTASQMRSQVHVRHAWYAVHKSPLGSCPEYLISEAMTPQRIGDDPMEPSRTWADYTVPQELPSDLRERLADFRDLALN